jgi:hypothetical protein
MTKQSGWHDAKTDGRRSDWHQQKWLYHAELELDNGMPTRGAARTAYSGRQDCDAQGLTMHTKEPLTASKIVCMDKATGQRRKRRVDRTVLEEQPASRDSVPIKLDRDADQDIQMTDSTCAEDTG